MIDETGAHGVKLEGGVAMQARCAGHFRFRYSGNGPYRSVAAARGLSQKFRITGKTDEEALQLMRDCEALAEAGVFSIVMEGMIEPVASAVAAACPVPASVLAPRQTVTARFSLPRIC